MRAEAGAGGCRFGSTNWRGEVMDTGKTFNDTPTQP
jgi:hypothetical protein